MLTQERAKELFNYDQITGLLVWRIKPAFNKLHLIGRPAGTIQTGNGGNRRIKILIDKQCYFASRIIWLIKTGCWPDQVDHENGDSMDNRWHNLRNVNNLESQKNQSRYKNNTSGITGVYWKKDRNQWMTMIGIDRQLVYLGCYLDFFDACCARKSAEHKYGFHHNHGRKKCNLN